MTYKERPWLAVFDDATNMLFFVCLFSRKVLVWEIEDSTPAIWATYGKYYFVDFLEVVNSVSYKFDEVWRYKGEKISLPIAFTAYHHCQGLMTMMICGLVMKKILFKKKNHIKCCVWEWFYLNKFDETGSLVYGSNKELSHSWFNTLLNKLGVSHAVCLRFTYLCFLCQNRPGKIKSNDREGLGLCPWF